MNTNPTTATILATCDPENDFAMCDTCEITKFDDTRECDVSGIVTCSACEDAYNDEMLRSLPLSAHFPTDEQLREDDLLVEAMCGTGSDEHVKTQALLNR